MKEEELVIPPLLKDKFTEAENDACINKIIQGGGLEMARIFFPQIKSAMEDWASNEFNDEFMAKPPPPVVHLVNRYYIPDYKTYVCPMRDAPLAETKPRLWRIPCCRIPGCFPCLV